MKLWILEVKEKWKNKGPWYSEIDKSIAFAIRAENETSARQLANKAGGDENSRDIHPWLDSEYTSCLEITPEGEPGILVHDYHAG